jgi:cbb3-type cytochrome oxidase subunit 3
MLKRCQNSRFDSNIRYIGTFSVAYFTILQYLFLIIIYVPSGKTPRPSAASVVDRFIQISAEIGKKTLDLFANA